MLYGILQWTWGFPQTLVGFVLSLIFRGDSKRFFGASVRRWRFRGSVSLGRYIFLSESANAQHDLLIHEYGHTIQSLILGPLYLAVVGIPSLLWAGMPAFARYRKQRGVDYDSVYPENWANALGKRFCEEHSK